MFGGLIAKIALGALWSKAKTNAVHDWQAIPPKARLWILGIVCALILATVHQIYAHHVIKEAKADSYKAGYAQAIKDIRAEEAKKVAPIVAAKVQTDAKNDAFHEGETKKHDTQVAHIDSNLADLLGGLRDDQAAAGHHADAEGGVHQADGAGGAVRAPSRADDGLAQGAQPAPDEDAAVVTVPAKQLYVRSAQCDRDYAALTAWEDTYQNYMQSYNDWLAKTQKVSKR